MKQILVHHDSQDGLNSSITSETTADIPTNTARPGSNDISNVIIISGFIIILVSIIITVTWFKKKKK